MGSTRKTINFLAYRDPTARHPKNKLTRGKQKKAGPRILLALRLVYHLFVTFASSIKQMKRDPSHISQAVPGHLTGQVQKDAGHVGIRMLPPSPLPRKIQKEDVP